MPAKRTEISVHPRASGVLAGGVDVPSVACFHKWFLRLEKKASKLASSKARDAAGRNPKDSPDEKQGQLRLAESASRVAKTRHVLLREHGGQSDARVWYSGKNGEEVPGDD